MIGYRLPTRVHIQTGSLRRIGEVLANLQAQRLLLVLDRGLRETPWPDQMRQLLEQAGVAAVEFDAVEPNPRTHSVEQAAELAREEKLQAVIGLGGGSVLDAAKAAAMLATNGGRAAQYQGANRFSQQPLPFVAIPTTCGTGSEVTWVSVLTDAEQQTKISVKGEAMFPDQALVDDELIATLPAGLIAATGMDAFTHAIEATTCHLANPVSDLLAETAMKLLWQYLPRLVADPTGDDEAREAVMRASTVAGMSFGNADVAAVHCLSEAMGGMLDVPHGLTNALLLAPVLRYNRDFITPRLAQVCDLLLDSVDPREEESNKAARFLEALEQRVSSLGMPSFDHLGVQADQVEEIARRAEENGSNSSNARPMAAEDYATLLRGLL